MLFFSASRPRAYGRDHVHVLATSHTHYAADTTGPRYSPNTAHFTDTLLRQRLHLASAGRFGPFSVLENNSITCSRRLTSLASPYSSSTPYPAPRSPRRGGGGFVVDGSCHKFHNQMASCLSHVQVPTVCHYFCSYSLTGSSRGCTTASPLHVWPVQRWCKLVGTKIAGHCITGPSSRWDQIGSSRATQQAHADWADGSGKTGALTVSQIGHQGFDDDDGDDGLCCPSPCTLAVQEVRTTKAWCGRVSLALCSTNLAARMSHSRLA